MTPDTSELRRLAEAATPGERRPDQYTGAGKWPEDADYWAATPPAVVLGLLDRIEALEAPMRTVDRLAEAIHDATPVEEDGGLPDVCNRWPEHEALATRIRTLLETP